MRTIQEMAREAGVIDSRDDYIPKGLEAFVALVREELAALKAQPEQKPVACMVENNDYGVMVWPIEDINEAGTYCEENEFPVLLYTTPPQRAWVGSGDLEDSNAYLTQPAQQEPCGWQFQDQAGEWHNFMDQKHYEDTVEEGSWPIRAIYTTPPQRKPLTDELQSLRQFRDAAFLAHPNIDLDIEAAHGIKENT